MRSSELSHDRITRETLSNNNPCPSSPSSTIYIYIYIYIYTHTHTYIYISITQDNKAFLADSKNRQEFLYYLLRLMMNNYSPKMRVWVAAGNTKSGWCTAIELNYIVIEQDCKRILHPFICETGKRMFVVF